MIITEREVKRVVSNYFKNKYKMDIEPVDMHWQYERIAGYENEEMVSGLDIGGIDEENNSDSD